MPSTSSPSRSNRGNTAAARHDTRRGAAPYPNAHPVFWTSRRCPAPVVVARLVAILCRLYIVVNFADAPTVLRFRGHALQAHLFTLPALPGATHQPNKQPYKQKQNPVATRTVEPPLVCVGPPRFVAATPGGKQLGSAREKGQQVGDRHPPATAAIEYRKQGGGLARAQKAAATASVAGTAAGPAPASV